MDRLGLSLFLQRTAGLARRMQSASLSEGECFHAERATAVTANLHAARELNGFLQPSFGGGGAGGGGGGYFSSYLSWLHMNLTIMWKILGNLGKS